jgi:hypothetical protein
MKMEMLNLTGKRSNVSEQIQVGSIQLNLVVGFLHLVQDYARRGILANTNGMLPVTLDFIIIALQHTLIREGHANNKENASKAAESETLTFKIDFQSWTCGLMNY